MHILFLIVALVFNAVANLLMKAGMIQAPQSGGMAAAARHYLTSWPVIIGIFMFALNVLAYTQALIKIPISIAYPIMTGTGFAIIGIAGYFLFKEHLSAIQIAGIILILMGIIMISRNHAGPDQPAARSGYESPRVSADC
ncbi:hypothetical protein JXA40_06665 [bacterium]|nr:hypothetical protein [candidate division CSSED10-310 bacterium]